MRRRRILALVVVGFFAGLTLYDGLIWFLCYLVVISGVGIVMVKIRRDWKSTKSRMDAELERAHRAPTEYTWRPWARSDYLERRRR